MENRVEFSNVYITYYPKLIRFAKEYVELNSEAEDLTQDVFTDLWERWDFVTEHVDNLNAYLFRLVKNKCMDSLRRKEREAKYVAHTQAAYELELQLKIQSLRRFKEIGGMNLDEMCILVRSAVNRLPERCRHIFLMCHVKRMKYSEIADQLHISIHTVESQVTIAYRKLRQYLCVPQVA